MWFPKVEIDELWVIIYSTLPASYIIQGCTVDWHFTLENAGVIHMKGTSASKHQKPKPTCLCFCPVFVP